MVGWISQSLETCILDPFIEHKMQNSEVPIINDPASKKGQRRQHDARDKYSSPLKEKNKTRPLIGHSIGEITPYGSRRIWTELRS
jgi:hypothetical protein